MKQDDETSDRLVTEAAFYTDGGGHRLRWPRTVRYGANSVAYGEVDPVMVAARDLGVGIGQFRESGLSGAFSRLHYICYSSRDGYKLLPAAFVPIAVAGSAGMAERSVSPLPQSKYIRVYDE